MGDENKLKVDDTSNYLNWISSMQSKDQQQKDTLNQNIEKIRKLKIEALNLEKENEKLKLCKESESKGLKHEFQKIMDYLYGTLTSLTLDYKEFKKSAPLNESSVDSIYLLNCEYDKKLKQSLEFIKNENEIIINSKQDKIPKFKATVEHFDTKLTDINNLMQHLMETEKELINKKSGIEKEILNVKEIISKKQNSISELTVNFMNLKISHTEKEQRLKFLQEKLNAFQEEKNEFNSKIKSVFEKYEAEKLEVENLSNMIEKRTTTQKEFNKLMEEIEMIKIELQGQESSEKLMASCKKLEAEIQAMTAKYRTIQRNLEKMPPMPIDEVAFYKQIRRVRSIILALRYEQKILVERQKLQIEGASEMLKVSRFYFAQMKECYKILKGLQKHWKQQPESTKKWKTQLKHQTRIPPLPKFVGNWLDEDEEATDNSPMP